MARPRMPTRRVGAHAARGIALVEIMVALTVAMLAALLMFQTMWVGEKSRRATGSGNDGLRAGVLALDQLAWSVRGAGSGLAQAPGSYNCALQLWRNAGLVRAYPRAGALPAPFNRVPLNPLRVAPVTVIDGGPDPDVIVVMSGSSPSANNAIPRGEPQVLGQFLAVTNTVGLQNNDLVLLTRYHVDALGTSWSEDCYVAQINALPAQVDAATGYLAVNPVPVALGFYSPPVGVLPAGRFTLSTLGTAPSIVAYGIRRSGGRSDLVSYDLLRDVGPTVIAENIVDLQVLYGVDSSVKVGGRNVSSDADFYGDGTVDQWVPPTGDWSLAGMTSVGTAGAPAWSGAERQRRVKALRVALIAADTWVDKDPIPLADNRLRMFASGDSANEVERTIGVDGLDNRTRYRVFEAMVPVRNLTGVLSPVADELVY